jgi:LysM repeat protein
MFRRLSAVTRNRKQRVAAAAVPGAEMEVDDGSSKISRALTIIFLIHIVAIGLIFIHQRFLDGRPAESSDTVKSTVAAATPAAPQRADLPRLSSGEKPYIVKPGDNYARIAAAEGVDEGELSLLNKHVDIGPGLILKLPPKRIVAEDPPEVTAIREQTPSDLNRGLVEAVDVTNAPKAQLVRPNTTYGTPPEPAAPVLANSGKSYVVQPGDSVWRIANRFKISQDNLMRANGISDARKMKTGMKLVIPQG